MSLARARRAAWICGMPRLYAAARYDPLVGTSEPGTPEVPPKIDTSRFAILHFVPDEWGPAKILASLTAALPPGSYVAASHLVTDHAPDSATGGQAAMREAGIPMQRRESREFAALAFSGLELVPPGVVLVSEWRPEAGGPRPTPAEVNCYGGVGRKPLCPRSDPRVNLLTDFSLLP
jgi:S-adenosyl methyltransferase